MQSVKVGEVYEFPINPGIPSWLRISLPDRNPHNQNSFLIFTIRYAGDNEILVYGSEKYKEI